MRGRKKVIMKAATRDNFGKKGQGTLRERGGRREARGEGKRQ